MPSPSNIFLFSYRGAWTEYLVLSENAIYAKKLIHSKLSKSDLNDWDEDDAVIKKHSIDDGVLSISIS